MSTILVTGAAGFIGSHVCDKLLARGDEVVGIDNLNSYYDPNLTGTRLVLEAARDHGRGHVVLASTSSVYGNTTRIPFDEEDRADRPLAPYAASKRAAEMLGFTHHHLFDQSVTCLRFFTVYGPRGRPDMMAHKVLDNIFFGHEVPLYNKGQMHRDWTFVDDIVDGVVGAVDNPHGYQVLNLGRGEPILLADFVALIEACAGKTANLVDRSAPAADVDYTFANIDRARDAIGYAPKISVKEGVTRFWHWYQNAVLGG
jgi:UDP-glucuronate 4-epimerase